MYFGHPTNDLLGFLGVFAILSEDLWLQMHVGLVFEVRLIREDEEIDDIILNLS